jgi:hypothetical protein
MDTTAWQEQAERVDRLTADVNTLLGEVALAVQQTKKLLAKSRQALAALEELLASAHERVRQTQEEQAGTGSAISAPGVPHGRLAGRGGDATEARPPHGAGGGSLR